MRSLAAVAALLPLVLLAGPAGAQDGDAPGDVRLVVSGLSTLLGPGTLPADASDDQREDAERVAVRVLVENRGDEPVEGLRLSIEVFEAISFRSTVRTALDLDEPRQRLRSLATDFVDVRDGGELAPGDIAGVTFASTADELRISRQGGAGVVFPLRLSVVQGIDPLDQVTTSVIYLRTPVEEPLLTVVGWPLDDQPWRSPGGTYPADVDRPITSGGRLDTLLRAAERHPDLPLTHLPGPHLLEDLADRADGFVRVPADGEPVEVAAEEPAAARAAGFLGRVRELLGGALSAPVTGPYADVDVSGLTRAPAPLDDEAASAITRGRLRLADVAGRAPDGTSYWASTSLDRATLDVLVNQTATDRVLLPFDQLGYTGDLDSFPSDVPGPLIQLLSPSGRSVLALVPDPYVDRALREPDREHGPVVAAQRVLAETAVLWTELPLTPRPLVILPPPAWDPFPRYATALVDALASAPWLAVRPPESLDPLAVGRDESIRLPGSTGVLTEGFVSSLLQTRRELAAVQQALPDNDGVIAGRDVDELELQLLRAPSAWFDDAERQASIDDVRAAIDQAYGRVDVAEGARITLTSDTGQIPVTIQRPSGGPLDVVIEIEETRANLDWPEGRQKRVTLPGTGAQTFSFAVEARSTGSFTVDVRVTDPAGVRELAVGTFTIRSTAISGPALVGTGVVVALLLAVGFARRRPERPKLEVVG